jgi:hypothetical protein
MMTVSLYGVVGAAPLCLFIYFVAGLDLFLKAALNEMSGKELELATDPDCSIILERMLHSMDDFSLRVFLDRLSGS